MFVNYATQPYKSLMQMARAKRVDLFPGFSYEMQFLSRNDGVALQTMCFYALSEQPKFLLGYAACAKSVVGQATIPTINDVLARLAYKLSNQTDDCQLLIRTHHLASGFALETQTAFLFNVTL